MAISYSVERIDSDGRELLTYGSKEFPVAFFDDDLAKIPYPWHWHNELEIAIITEGSIRMRIANSELVLNKGDGIFTNSGILHAAKLLTKTGHQHCMVFAPDVIARPEDIVWRFYIEPILGNRSIPFIKLSAADPWQSEILRLAEAAWIDGAYEKKEYPLTVRHNLGQVLSLIQAHMDLLETETLYTDKAQKDEFRIKKALQFIETQYATPITIDEIARSADISVSSCLRLFKSVMDTTPVKYLIRYRLQKAVEEFEHLRGRSISEIAYACGFSDAAYFNRCFKKEYGCTPSQYIANAAAAL